MGNLGSSEAFAERNKIQSFAYLVQVSLAVIKSGKNLQLKIVNKLLKVECGMA